MAAMTGDSSSSSAAPEAGRFATTHWSIVVSAGGRRDEPQAREALATLCQAYWYPLYAYLRRQGTPAGDAQDLVQAFFCELLEKDRLAAADQQRGRFRSFLLISLKHFQANQWRRAAAQKRGGGAAALSLDLEAGERRFALEPAHEQTAERIFQRQWAMTVLEQALGALRAEFAAAGKAELFERLKEHVGGDQNRVPYRELAAGLNMTEGALKVAVHRFRGRWREALRDQIAQTVAGPAEVEQELRELFDAVGE
jgi:RNA polymerase sigma-70 factor (ECF subfamily)